jgi:hypothetical protein
MTALLAPFGAIEGAIPCQKLYAAEVFFIYIIDFLERVKGIEPSS